MPLHLKLEERHSQMARATELCVLTEDKEMEMISKSKIIFPRQSYLFKLDPNNRLSVQELRDLIAPDRDEYLRLILESDTLHDEAHITDILDLAEKFHLVLWKGKGWSVDPSGCSCTTCYKHVHCCHGRLLSMALDDKIKVPKSREIAEPSLRKGRVMGRGTAGQKRKLHGLHDIKL